MALVWDLFSEDELADEIGNGYVSQQRHSLLPLTILNYTKRCQYEGRWNHVTRQCRGLIYNDEDGSLVVRPMPKFFNLGEHEISEIPRLPFRVFDKLDGSLGLLYDADGSLGLLRHVVPAVATRGSFASPQALWATRFYRERMEHLWLPQPELSYMFEIIYPENRIVVDYEGFAGLVLLEVLDTATGESVLDEHAKYWPGPVAKEYDFTSVDDIAAAPPRENAEGYVIRFDNGMRVKAKHAEYVRLHRIITGVSSRTIWESLATGTPSLDEILDRVPDEFYEWVADVARGLRSDFEQIEYDAWLAYNRVRGLPETHHEPPTRKEQALALAKHPLKSIVFMMLDGRDYAPAIWRLVKPEHSKPFQVQIEEAA